MCTLKQCCAGLLSDSVCVLECCMAAHYLCMPFGVFHGCRLVVCAFLECRACLLSSCGCSLKDCARFLSSCVCFLDLCAESPSDRISFFRDVSDRR